MEQAGFKRAARLRDAWRIEENRWLDVEQYHRLMLDTQGAEA